VTEPTPPPEADLARLLLIRHFEQALLDLYGRGEISGTVHTCLGQEYIPVALAPLLDGDIVFSNHRGHGHYLALCDDPESLMAEILGRAGAVCRGVGGSQHVFVPDRFLSTGVQGESVPVAVGTALSLRRAGGGRLAAVFIGDGTLGEGAVYEGLNMAQLWRVPLLVVVEHNGIAQTTPTRLQLAGSVAGRAAAFGIAHERVEGHDIAAIRARLGPAIAAVRNDFQPLVVEFDTIRLGPHSKGDDTRDAAEIARLAERDWAPAYAARWPERFAEIDREQRERVERIVADVLGRPLSTWVVPVAAA
jgi:pyruvate dehydrogenase E1 component alpha subunit